jgi:putative ABC transport system ATP-binding protein
MTTIAPPIADAPPVPTRPVRLEFRDVVKHYVLGGEIVRPVDGVSLTVAAGEVVAIFGPSGSGKSTLLMIAAAVLRPDSGGVYVDGRDVTALSESDAADYRMLELGFVLQSVELLSGGNVMDNAMLKLVGAGVGLRQARRRMAGLLEELGLGERLKHRPDQLSMGERQRVMIARALSTEPKVLLADEPTGSLDVTRTHEVLAKLRAMTRERQMATVLVTHDAQAAEYADRVYTLENGVLSTTQPTSIAPPP